MRLGSFRRYINNLSDSNFGTCFSDIKYLDLVVTKKCNFRCCHCDAWKIGDSNEMSHEQWFKVLSQISKMGIRPIIEISGGEPLIKKDLSLKIADEGSRLGLSMFLNTNGALIDEQSAEDILRSGLKSVKISLYSLDEKINDELRQMPGACKKTKEALGFLKEKNTKKEFKIEVATLLTGLNIESINNLIDYCERNGFNLIIQPLDFCLERPYEENWQKESSLWPQEWQVIKYLKPLIEQKSKIIKNPPFYLKLIYQYYLDPDSLKKRRCLAPYNNLVVWPNGDLALCFRSNIVGNILNSGVPEAWQAEKAKMERKRLQTCQKSCKIIGCNIKKQIKDFIL